MNANKTDEIIRSIRLNQEQMAKVEQIKQRITSHKLRGPTFCDAVRYCINQAEIPQDTHQ